MSDTSPTNVRIVRTKNGLRGRNARGRWERFDMFDGMPEDYWPVTDKIFEALTEFPCMKSLNELILYVWPNPDDEPEWSSSCIPAAIVRLRKKLRVKFPWLAVVARGGYYRLVIRRPPGYNMFVRTPGANGTSGGA